MLWHVQGCHTAVIREDQDRIGDILQSEWEL